MQLRAAADALVERTSDPAVRSYPQPKVQVPFNFKFRRKIAREVKVLRGMSPTKRADFSYQTGGPFPTKRADFPYQTGDMGQQAFTSGVTRMRLLPNGRPDDGPKVGSADDVSYQTGVPYTYLRIGGVGGRRVP